MPEYTGSEFLFASQTTTLIASDFALALQAGDGAGYGDGAGAGDGHGNGNGNGVGDSDSNGDGAGVCEPRGVMRGVQALFEQALTSGIAQPVLVGAVPFDVTRAPRLSIARNCQRVELHDASQSDPAWQASDGLQADPSLATPHDVHVAAQTAHPAPAVYEAAVAEALARFEQGELGKVVLSRTLALALDGPLHLPSLIARMLAKNTHGYTYAVPLATPGEVFIGATPELLVRRSGSRVILNPLAGSAARCLHAREDELAGQALTRSCKDLEEHAIVIDAIAKVLRPLCRTLAVPATPSLIATDALWHLSTVIEGELMDPATTSLDLAFALHPTPAVCGYPTQVALNAIEQLEPFDRGFFAGFVGWMDASGDGEWAVSLRCAHCGPAHATLYAGAGIVPGSVPAKETAETQTKFRTMLSALGLGQSIEQR